MASTLMAGALLVAGACTAEREPTAPKAFAGSGPSFSLVATANDINALIDQLFPPPPPPKPGLRTAAHAQFTNIQRVLAAGNVADAQAKAFALIDFASQKFFNNQLIGKQSSSTQELLRQLINDLLSYVGLAGDGSDAAAQVVGPSGGTVVTGSELAGADFPPGALPQNVIVTINRAPNQLNPLPTVLQQFPLFYEFKTFPEVPQFGELVTVGVCVLDGPVNLAGVDPGNLRLAHPLHSDPTAIEILPFAAAPFVDPGNCLAAGDGFGIRSGLRSDLASLGKTVAQDLFWLAMGAPKDLSATSTGRRMMPGGLGGRTGSFSTFGAVDFTGHEFVPYQEIGYRYLIGTTPPAGFELPSFIPTGWSTGRGAFGSGGEPCTFLESTIHTTWPVAGASPTEILLRKRFSGSAQNVQILVPVDNDVKVFVNGHDITDSVTLAEPNFGEDGFLIHDGCADPADPFVFPVPNSFLLPGGNLVVVRARDRGVVSYVDVKVTGTLPVIEEP
jgi:hypothetical protein